MRVPLLVAIAAFCFFRPSLASTQAPKDALSVAEVEALRESAYIPSDRIQTYERILDARVRRIDELAKGRHVGRALDLHDAIEEYTGIVEELNDNLDEYERQHRDIRKALVRLLTATERWSVTLNAPADNDAYNTVRKIALHNTEDARVLTREVLAALESYFKEHPEAALAEKKRKESPHAPTADGRH